MTLHQTISLETIQEYVRATEKFGAINNSSHESYAVILEEFEEAMAYTEAFQNNLQVFWEAVKQNKPSEAKALILKAMQDFAEPIAAEWVQISAMCHKAILTEGGLPDDADEQT